MRILEPILIDVAQVVTSNIVEDEYPAWAAGSYALGDLVIHNNAIFESLVDANAAEPGTDETKWFRRSSTNKFKAFDQSNNSQAERVDQITFTILPGKRVDLVALIDLVATDVTVSIVVPGNVDPVYTLNKSALRSENRATFYNWAFGSRSYRRTLVFSGLPTYADVSNATIEIEINNAGGVAKVGEILSGLVWQVGKTMYETEPRIRSYSVDTRDDFGNLISTKRRASRAVSYRFAMATGQIDFTLGRLENLTATKLLFLGGDGIERLGTTLFGTFRDFSAPIEGPNGLTAQIDVEGFIG
jgi:hypothetical protein